MISITQCLALLSISLTILLTYSMSFGGICSELSHKSEYNSENKKRFMKKSTSYRSNRLLCSSIVDKLTWSSPCGPDTVKEDNDFVLPMDRFSEETGKIHATGLNWFQMLFDDFRSCYCSNSLKQTFFIGGSPLSVGHAAFEKYMDEIIVELNRSESEGFVFEITAPKFMNLVEIIMKRKYPCLLLMYSMLSEAASFLNRNYGVIDQTWECGKADYYIVNINYSVTQADQDITLGQNAASVGKSEAAKKILHINQSMSDKWSKICQAISNNHPSMKDYVDQYSVKVKNEIDRIPVDAHYAFSDFYDATYGSVHIIALNKLRGICKDLNVIDPIVLLQGFTG